MRTTGQVRVQVADALVSLICRYAERYHDQPADMIEQFRCMPTVCRLDRLFSYRSDPMIDEFRAALMRHEDGVFGICRSCSNRIGDDHLMIFPCARLCEACDEEHTRDNKTLFLSGKRTVREDCGRTAGSKQRGKVHA